MPGSNQKTKVSPRTQPVRATAVIEFQTAPRYRGNAVDISANLFVRYFGPTSLIGNAESGPRSIVECVDQVSRRCKVLTLPGTFIIHHSHTGRISEGIRDV